MQIMADAVAVLGSRHGFFFNPFEKHLELLRFERFSKMRRLGLRAGLRIGSREVIFPFSPNGEVFAFLDQRMTPCTWSMIGIDPASALKVKLTATTPFRPKDQEFSTTPVIQWTMGVERLGGQYRWEKIELDPDSVELFMEWETGDVLSQENGVDALDLKFEEQRTEHRGGNHEGGEVDWTQIRSESVEQQDRIVVLEGERRGTQWIRTVQPKQSGDQILSVAWCTWSGPVLEVQGTRCPFLYTKKFSDLNAVVGWVRKNPKAILENAAKVDGLVGQNDLGPATNRMLALTLHSWLINTWWVCRPDGRDWFSVWEGSCYFHSTVDVEFTQAPFYLAVWPELLGIELDFWPEYSKSGESILGERGKGTLFLSHDTGAYSKASGQLYPHEMEVEETANWILMAFAHAKRTGSLALVKKHATPLEKYLEFLIACDTTGNGVPDHGVANTIDDASPAVQYGKEQTYLAVKTLGALEVGIELLQRIKRVGLIKRVKVQAVKLRRTIQKKAWSKDHFTVLLEKSGTLKDPWTGNVVTWKSIPGWDAPHIYTANTLPILDMVGFDLKLDRKKVIQDLEVSTRRCLREYGCVHTDFNREDQSKLQQATGLAGAARNPGWIAMNLLRDLAAYYRGLDFRLLTQRYWDWQVVTNTREVKLFYETFGGNNLNFYPRGVVAWGIFDAVNGVSIDLLAKKRRKVSKPIAQAPILWNADWRKGKAGRL